MPTRQRNAHQGVFWAVAFFVASAVPVLGLPAALVVVVGRLYPPHGEAVIGIHGLFDLVGLILWLLWAYVTATLTWATVVQYRHGYTPARVPGGVDGWAVRLAGAAVIIGSFFATGGPSGAAVAARPAAQAVVSTAAAVPPVDPAPSPTQPVPAAAPAPAAPATVTVQPGDTLWSIAQTAYGTGDKWTLIAGANLGKVMDDGATFDDPDLIMPGWLLVVPPEPGSTAPVAATDPAPVPMTAPAPTVPAQPSPPAQSSAPVQPTVPAHPVIPAKASQSGHVASGTGTVHLHPGPATTAPPAGSSVGGRSPAEEESSRPASHGSPANEEVPVPLISALGIGALGAAVLARRITRDRARARLNRDIGQVSVPMTPTERKVVSELARFERLSITTLLGQGLSHLTSAIGDNQTSVPHVRLVRVGPKGLTLLLGEPAPTAPGAFEAIDDGWCWYLDRETDLADLPGANDGEPWLPALVVAGEDGDETVLVPVEPGEVLPASGSHAEPWVTAAQITAESWEWAESRLFVTSTPTQAVELAHMVGTPRDTVERVRVLFFGDPGTVDDRTRQLVGIVTSAPVQAPAPPTGPLLTCEEELAQLDPFGILLRCPALEPPAAAAVLEALAGAASEPVDPPTEPSLPVQPPPKEEGTLGFPLPGPIEFRVLTATPRIDGASGPGPQGRAERAAELGAYLALDGGVVPMHEIRATALATTAGDASVQTVRQVAMTLRQWIGTEHLPNAERGGYSTGPGVTTDLGRFQTALSLATQIPDPDAQVHLLRSALELIEGRPTSRTRKGWEWWTIYDTQARDAACTAACLLAPLLADRGDANGVHWAIDQARLVDPWSEALYRTAIECAGHLQNFGWVNREWVALGKMIDDLEPGATPSEATFRAYEAAMTPFTPPSPGSAAPMAAAG